MPLKKEEKSVALKIMYPEPTFICQVTIGASDPDQSIEQNPKATEKMIKKARTRQM
jgi:hypothetical protein